jgi:hypothetical protein
MQHAEPILATVTELKQVNSGIEKAVYIQTVGNTTGYTR